MLSRAKMPFPMKRAWCCLHAEWNTGLKWTENIQGRELLPRLSSGEKQNLRAVPKRGGPIRNPIGVSAKLVARMDDVRFIVIGSNDRL
jgi:hypothetical protein